MRVKKRAKRIAEQKASKCHLNQRYLIVSKKSFPNISQCANTFVIVVTVVENRF